MPPKTLRDLLPPYANVAAIARTLGITRQALHRALAGNLALAPERERALARVLGVRVRVVRAAFAETRKQAGG